MVSWTILVSRVASILQRDEGLSLGPGAGSGLGSWYG